MAGVAQGRLVPAAARFARQGPEKAAFEDARPCVAEMSAAVGFGS